MKAFLLIVALLVVGCSTKKEIVINDCPTLQTIDYNPIVIEDIELEYEVIDEKETN